jgi:transcriptional regulator with GAF, ATPase, and Fis domain
LFAAIAGKAALRLGEVNEAKEWSERMGPRTSAEPVLATALAETLTAELALVSGRSEKGIEIGSRELSRLSGLPSPPEVAAAALDLSRSSPTAAELRGTVLDWLDRAAAAFQMLGDHRGRERALALAVEWLRRSAPGPVVKDSQDLIHRVSWLLNSHSDLREMTQRAMRMAVEQLDAELGVLLLADPETGDLTPMAEYGAVNASTRRDALGWSRRVVQRVAESGGSILMVDAPSDSRVVSDSIADMRVLSILCVPLFLGGRAVGAVYLSDTRRSHAFGEADRGTIEGFAQLMAIAIENSRGHEEVRRAKELLEGENLSLRQEVGARLRAHPTLGSSAAMQRVMATVDAAARTNATVLITGENGTGKEYIARLLHHSGRRRLKPFVVVNCGAIPETLIESELFGILDNVATGVRARPGKFVQADGGTLFLDEIGEMPLGQQVALLSVLANREITPLGSARPVPVDVRIIAATNKDLRRLVEQGAFREDLYYRLNIMEIEVPALRERKADVLALAQHFLAQSAQAQGIPPPQMSPELHAALMQSDWPGNVRELQNYMERLIAMNPGPVLQPQPLPRDLEKRGLAPRPGRRRLHEAVGEIEQRLLVEALERSRGNQSHAARELGLTEQAIRYRIRKYGLARSRENRRNRQKQR